MYVHDARLSGKDRTIREMFARRALIASAAAVAISLTACGGSDSASTPEPSASPAPDASGIRVVSASEAAATIAEAPENLVILDVRTQEEFDEGHIEGAVMLDFYREDFAQELAKFDPEVPYVLYCRSGNRSSGARAIMADLGFQSVEDIDGGIVGWQEAGLPVVTG
jgi:rhodanese-related sulfurtransferase